ncbi:MAG: hypothetical protein ABUK01_18270 [Leptospirales bacterium]
MLSVFVSYAYANTTVNVSGDWIGRNFASQVGEYVNVTLHLVQTGNKVEGTYQLSTGDRGEGYGNAMKSL